MNLGKKILDKNRKYLGSEQAKLEACFVNEEIRIVIGKYMEKFGVDNSLAKMSIILTCLTDHMVFNAIPLMHFPGIDAEGWVDDFVADLKKQLLSEINNPEGSWAQGRKFAEEQLKKERKNGNQTPDA